MVDEETGELLPKMRELIQTATNGQVDIMDGEEFKSTYEINTLSPYGETHMLCA